MYFINIKEHGHYGKVETIDEFNTFKEAKEMIKEYRLNAYMDYQPYLSRRSTKEWASER